VGLAVFLFWFFFSFRETMSQKAGGIGQDPVPTVGKQSLDDDPTWRMIGSESNPYTGLVVNKLLQSKLQPMRARQAREGFLRLETEKKIDPEDATRAAATMREQTEEITKTAAAEKAKE